MRLIPLLWTAALFAAAPPHDPAHLADDPALLADPGSLPLARGRTSTVYRAVQGEYQFNLHSYIARYGNEFWAVWSSGLVDEDSNGQLIRYARSADGHRWSEGRILAPDPDGLDGPGFWICRGLYVQNGRLTALLARIAERKTEQWPGLKLMRYEWDGARWKQAGLFLDDCMNNYPPERLGPNWFMTCRDSFRKMSTALSPDLADGNWKRTPLPLNTPDQYTSEPSTYVDPDGVAHTLFRDARRSGYLYRSLSRDFGVTWTAPVRTDYPDATSKNFSGRLSNGWYYLIDNPDRKSRDPLAIAFSRDGWTFGHPLAIRKKAEPGRYEGRSKNRRSFQYPHAIEHAGSLWVIYSTNKEDIEITELPLSSLPAAPAPDATRLLREDGLLAAPGQLKQAPGRHSMVFRGQKGVSGFNLHSYIAWHDGRYWAAWSSAMVHEEDPDQRILYATSPDGHRWSAASVLAPDPDGPSGAQRWITRGLFVEGGALQALGALVASAHYGGRGKGVVWEDLKLMRFTWTGKEWKPAGLYADDCMNNFPPVRIAGMYSMPCRDRYMNVSFRMSDSPAAGWKTIPISNEPPFHRMDEPTAYEAPDGTVHLVVRDGARTGRLIHIVSRDQGRSWDKPVSTNYPDATSKNFAARLSTGSYFLINNPDTGSRDPLAISFSSDGWTYDRPLALRKNAAPARFAVRKRPGGSFQYPHAMERNGSLWVIYSTNKEDIEISEFRLKDLGQ